MTMMDLSPATNAKIDQAAAHLRETLAERGIANLEGQAAVAAVVIADFLLATDPDVSVRGLIAHAAVQRALGVFP
jgi:hypothetical protein